MSTFSTASIAAWAFAVGAAALVRGRRGAIVAGVLLGIYTLVAATLAGYVGPALPIFVYLHSWRSQGFSARAPRDALPGLRARCSAGRERV
jgi:hypothetical protein